jgi:hypothetical protein
VKIIVDDAHLRRILHPTAETFGDAFNGAAIMRTAYGALRILFSDGMGWDHVSVSRPDRCPTWPEMCLVKDRFFDPDDCVVQFHPPQSMYVNDHPHCLHLWRWRGGEFPMPDPIMVGTSRKVHR